jgi:hypothetical protein
MTSRALPGHWTPHVLGYRGGYAWGYAWRFRIPQLYPPSRLQIPTQIHGARRSFGEPNQPRFALGAASLGLQSFHLSAGFVFQRFSVPPQTAPHHHGFQPDGCRRFIGGTVEMEQIRDEGEGLPADFDPHSAAGLGMRIVRAFSQQVNAEIAVRRLDPGTEFVVSVPREQNV